jgi:hypothetical protein
MPDTLLCTLLALDLLLALLDSELFDEFAIELLLLMLMATFWASSLFLEVFRMP